MSNEARKMLKEALELAPAERAEVAALLLESLEEAREADWEAAWEEEIARRDADLDAGRVKPLSHDEAFQAMFGADDGGSQN